MTRKITLLALTLAFAVGAAVGAFALGGSDAPTQVRNAATEDVSGPCDEAEHANDPRCAGNGGGQADDDDPGEDRHGGHGRDHPEDDGTVDDDGDDAGEDISGPCDEAEHANDPECAGVTPTPGTDDDVDDDDVDNSGPGSVDSGHDDADDDDNSGPGSVNSGPGSVNSGSSDDDSGSDDDDSSGSGSGGEDNSGSGSSSSGSGSSGSGGDDD